MYIKLTIWQTRSIDGFIILFFFGSFFFFLRDCSNFLNVCVIFARGMKYFGIHAYNLSRQRNLMIVCEEKIVLDLLATDLYVTLRSLALFFFWKCLACQHQPSAKLSISFRFVRLNGPASFSPFVYLFCALIFN